MHLYSVHIKDTTSEFACKYVNVEIGDNLFTCKMVDASVYREIRNTQTLDNKLLNE